MKKSLLLSVQKFSVHDGPGIRTTVFFKGCPLRCVWCHNPESQDFDASLLFDAEKCSGCLNCIQHCPASAIQKVSGQPHTDKTRCQACGACVETCLSSARVLAGADLHVDNLLEEIFKDQVFYEESGGGVTFSGGEALWHIEALEILAKACQQRGLHVAVDTCGFAPLETFRRIAPYTDLFLYDLKHMDAELHRFYTGQDNRLILENLRWLSDSGAAIFLRLPLIEGVNAEQGPIEDLLALAGGLRIKQVNLLPYHDTGGSKYARLSRASDRPSFAAPPLERLETIRRQFEKLGLPTVIGG